MSKIRSLVFAVGGLATLAVLVAGAGYVTDQRVSARGHEVVAEFMESFGEQVDRSLAEGGEALRRVAASGAAPCSAEEATVLARVAYDFPQILRVSRLTGQDGEACGTGRGGVEPKLLAGPFPLAADASYEIVGVEGTRFRGLRLKRSATEPGQSLAVTLPVVALGPAAVPPLARRLAHLRIRSADGLVLWSVQDGVERDPSDPEAASFPEGPEWAGAKQRIEPYGLVLESAIPMRVFHENFAGIIASFNLFAAAAGLLLLGAILHLAMRPPRAEAELERALKRGEFVPYYQPIIDLSRGRLAGCEMLVRRRLPNGEIVPPAAFIGLAEASGLALPMTRALMEACRTDLAEAYRTRPELKLSINLFDAHFTSLRLLSDVEKIFAKSGIRYEQLCFEITERQPLVNLDRARVIIRRLQALGAKVALDDAGTGHAGLAHLQQLGIDIIKIDKMFVDVIGKAGFAPIVDTLTALGRKLGMAVVAEGVESFDQVRYLQSVGVDMAQGYVFAPPLPARSFLTLVEAMAPDGSIAAGDLASAVSDGGQGAQAAGKGVAAA